MTAYWSRQSPQFFQLGELPVQRIEQPDPFADTTGRLVSRVHRRERCIALGRRRSAGVLESGLEAERGGRAPRHEHLAGTVAARAPDRPAVRADVQVASAPRQRLRGPCRAGPNGCLRLTQWLAGYAAPQEHVHSVWEELIFLAGDWLVPERDGVTRGGSYLGNPAGLWHGPVVTARGVLAIVHSTEQLDLTQRDRDDADELVARYLEGGSLEVPLA